MREQNAKHEHFHLNIMQILSRKPTAIANLYGSPEYPNIRGKVQFYPITRGVLVMAEVVGLPVPVGECKSPVFGFHIHGNGEEGGRCSGTPEDPFADSGVHYNAKECPHPFHNGDMPPLFGNNGYALSIFFTDRFTVSELKNKVVIIHSGADDFTTQPGGNAGRKIAYGEITIRR